MNVGDEVKIKPSAKEYFSSRAAVKDMHTKELTSLYYSQKWIVISMENSIARIGCNLGHIFINTDCLIPYNYVYDWTKKSVSIHETEVSNKSAVNKKKREEPAKSTFKIRKTVRVEYCSNPVSVKITADGKNFDTSRIDGMDIALWAEPFLLKKVKWEGFYDEMVNALGGERTFELIFEGSGADLQILKEAWGSAPVIVVSGDDMENLFKSANVVWDGFDEAYF